MKILPFTEKQTSVGGIAFSVMGIGLGIVLAKPILMFICGTTLLLNIVRFVSASISGDYSDSDY